MIRVTPDMAARAIVAAARSYGDDPVVALTGTGTRWRRALTAAAVGLVQGSGIHTERASRIITVSSGSVATAKRRGGANFLAAVEAATRAVRASLPEEPPKHVHRPAPGKITANVALPMPPAPRAPKPTAMLRDRILHALRQGPRSAPTLAILVDAKELAVIESLRCLAAEGVITAGPIPEQGARYRQWAAAQEVAA